MAICVAKSNAAVEPGTAEEGRAEEDGAEVEGTGEGPEELDGGEKGGGRPDFCGSEEVLIWM